MRRRILAGAVGLALILGASTHLRAEWATLEQIAVAGTAIGFTAANINEGNGHAQANIGVCRVRTAQVSVRWDGGTPTSSVGMLLEVGDLITIKSHEELVRFRAIRTTSTSGQLDCTVSEN